MVGARVEYVEKYILLVRPVSTVAYEVVNGMRQEGDVAHELVCQRYLVRLCYATDEDQELRMRVAEKMRQKVRMDEDGGISLLCEENNAADADRWLGGLKGSEVWAIRTEGSVSDWEILEKVPLAGSS